MFLSITYYPRELQFIVLVFERNDCIADICLWVMILPVFIRSASCKYMGYILRTQNASMQHYRTNGDFTPHELPCRVYSTYINKWTFNPNNNLLRFFWVSFSFCKDVLILAIRMKLFAFITCSWKPSLSLHDFNWQCFLRLHPLLNDLSPAYCVGF